MPIIKREVVERFAWLSDEEFVDTLAVTQSIPGAIAVNSAVFIGYKVRGCAGALLAMTGAVLPSFLVILLIAVFFVRFTEYPIVQAAFTGIRPAISRLNRGSSMESRQTNPQRPAKHYLCPGLFAAFPGVKDPCHAGNSFGCIKWSAAALSANKKEGKTGERG
ncbi:MAG: chromate transporter [Dethiobacteraceae bacterium]